MKHIVYLMMFYILGLSLMPCSDTDLLVSGHSDVHSHQTDESSPEHSHSACQPLCFCACCGTQANPLSVITNLDRLILVASSRLFIRTKTTLLPKFFEDIWQPPKIIITIH